ncbi:MAG: VOC family protein [Marinomonas foliarum]|uniref:Catechol 2,3-dioxygenase-like lactoylglutathione lyase family enzyme n=1 Tax=Marinomonas foliarum TaxID=491950 RepID=A0A368ZLS0_9GAMM|nr:VOC family protein [Marinomonas foliarum]QRV22536.1 drug:proton antiporter [Marinomonas foliarum]RCW95471.1 catechol 2,3-dioxygenase-like lactoylglutathione lyase family enzyme [Marinomonas foliarum]
MDLSNFTILYVDNVQRSVDFYRSLFEREPVEATESFALFVSETGAKFGLWVREDVFPTAKDVPAGSMEVALTLDNLITLQINYIKWRELGVDIIQEPTIMDFGTTFTALDPDGHRLRVYTPEKANNN